MTDAKAHDHAHHDATIPAERYAVEALALLGEGVAASRIEAAARAIGRAEGALATLDAIGLGRFDAALHAELDALAAAAGAKPHVHGSGCGHDHGHDHAHQHEHEHEHAHGDGTRHSHPHAHGHSHEHAHEHGACCGQAHGHDHGHAHGEHSHGHGRAVATVDVAAIARARRAKPKSQRFPEPAVYVIEKMSHGFGRSGRTAGAGFYDYPAEGEPALWSGLKVFERGAAEIDDATVQARLRAALGAAG